MNVKETNITAVSSVTMYLVALCVGVKQATPFRGMVLLVQVCMHSMCNNAVLMFAFLSVCFYLHVYIRSVCVSSYVVLLHLHRY